MRGPGWYIFIFAGSSGAIGASVLDSLLPESRLSMTLCLCRKFDHTVPGVLVGKQTFIDASEPLTTSMDLHCKLVFLENCCCLTKEAESKRGLSTFATLTFIGPSVAW